MNFTEKLIKIKSKYGLTTSKMSSVLGMSNAQFRNYKSKHLFKHKHFDLVCKYLENLQFDRRKF